MFDEQLSVFYSNILFASGGQNVALLNFGAYSIQCADNLSFSLQNGVGCAHYYYKKVIQKNPKKNR